MRHSAYWAKQRHPARAPVYLADSPVVDRMTGKYFDNCPEVAAAAQALDEKLARQLWVWSDDAMRDCL